MQKLLILYITLKDLQKAINALVAAIINKIKIALLILIVNICI